MTQSTVTFSGPAATAVSGNGTTYYGAWGNANFSTFANGIETNLQAHLSVATTLQTLYVQPAVNSRTTNTVITQRVATANGNGTVTVTAGSTAQFSDITHTDSVTATTLFDYKVVMGASAESLQIAALGCDQQASGSQATTVLTSVGNVAGSAGNTRWCSVVGGVISLRSTESEAYTHSIEGATVSYMQVRYAGANAATWNSRNNGAAGNQTFSANSAALFTDTTHTDSIAAGNPFNVEVVYGGTTSNVTLIGMQYASATASASLICSWSAPVVGSVATNYWNIGGAVIKSTTEALAQMVIPTAGYTKNFTVNLQAFATGAQTINLRKNGASVNQSLACSSATVVTDTTHTDTVVAGDLMNAMTGTGFISTDTIRAMSLLFLTGAPPGSPASGSLLTLGVG